MRCRAEVEIRIIELFLHNRTSWYPFSDDAIADAITEVAREYTNKGEVFKAISPNANQLERFTISWMPNINAAPKQFIKKCETEEDLMHLVGHRPLEILKAIDMITLDVL